MHEPETYYGDELKPIEFTNEPIEGFVLNKKVGGYATGWNYRATYTRVYDPRGFEIEIDITNLLYILENADCIKGKGILGKMIYGWSGKDLILIPENAPEYAEMVAFTNLQELSVSAKNLKPGFTYETKQKVLRTYLGKFNEWVEYFEDHRGRKTTYDYNVYKSLGWKSTKKHYFADLHERLGKQEFTISTSTTVNNIARLHSTDPDPKYGEYLDFIENCSYYSPVDRYELRDVDMSKDDMTKSTEYIVEHDGSVYIMYMDTRRNTGIQMYNSDNEKIHMADGGYRRTVHMHKTDQRYRRISNSSYGHYSNDPLTISFGLFGNTDYSVEFLKSKFNYKHRVTILKNGKELNE